jgi:hypothetical protein
VGVTASRREIVVGLARVAVLRRRRRNYKSVLRRV